MFDSTQLLFRRWSSCSVPTQWTFLLPGTTGFCQGLSPGSRIQKQWQWMPSTSNSRERTLIVFPLRLAFQGYCRKSCISRQQSPWWLQAGKPLGYQTFKGCFWLLQCSSSTSLGCRFRIRTASSGTGIYTASGSQDLSQGCWPTGRLHRLGSEDPEGQDLCLSLEGIQAVVPV